MTTLIAIYLFMIGLVFGSFFNVVALRIPLGQSVLHPPSSCPNCKTRLKARDLLPVISYLSSGGKCRYCNSKVSSVYPFGEFATGVAYVWVYLHFGFTWEALTAWLLISLLVIITIADLVYMRIPNKILIFFLPLFIVMRLVSHEQSWWHYVLGAVAGGGLIILIAVASKGGMGMGDAKLMLLCGFVLGYSQIITGFLLACFIGTIVGGVLQALKITKRKQPIPFGPYLALGIGIAYGYGSDLINAYLTLIG